MNTRITNSLLTRMRKAFAAGNAVGIIGWRESNHDDFTRALPVEKVIFSVGTNIPQRVAFVLLTRFVSHAMSAQLKKKYSVHTIPLDTGVIKRFLSECADLLQPTAHLRPR